MRRGYQVWPSLGRSSGAGVFHEHSRDWVPTLVSSMLLGPWPRPPSPLPKGPLRLDRLQDPRAHTSEHLPRECPLPERRWQELDTQGPELAVQLANCPWDLWASQSLVWASVSSSVEWVTVIPVPNLHSP